MTVQIPSPVDATLFVGFSAFFGGLLGLDAHQVMWGVIGSVIGASIASTVGLWYSVVRFVAASLASALLGTVLAEYIGHDSGNIRNAVIFLLGAGFHPALSAFLDIIPHLASVTKDLMIRFVKRTTGRR